MLVINRRKDQEFILGDNIRIVILSVKNNKVKFGIHAPADVTIRRRVQTGDDSAKSHIAETAGPENPCEAATTNR